MFQIIHQRRLILIILSIYVVWYILSDHHSSRRSYGVYRDIGPLKPLVDYNSTAYRFSTQGREYYSRWKGVGQCSFIEQMMEDKDASALGFAFMTSPTGAISLYHEGTLVAFDKPNKEPYNLDGSPLYFCAVITLPKTHSREKSVLQQENSYLDYGPDSLHLTVESKNVKIQLPQPSLVSSTQFSNIYTVAFDIRHSGTYKLTGEVEWSDFEWEMLQNPEDLKETVFNNKVIQTFPEEIIVKGQAVPRPQKKCYSSSSSVHGRWYKASIFGVGGIMKPSLEDFDNDQIIDEWGFVFQPDDCYLDFYPPDKAFKCLKSQTIDVFGDSNGRRLLKNIISGSTWCSSIADACQCSDNAETVIEDSRGINIDVHKFHRVGNKEKILPHVRFGIRSNAFFDFVGGLDHQHNDNDYRNYFSIDYGPSIMKLRFADTPIDILILSLVGWDIAGSVDINLVRERLKALREVVLVSFPMNTKIIIRLANSVCCGNFNGSNRFALSRFEIFNQLWRETFGDVEGRGVIFLDSFVLEGRSEPEVHYPCPQSHFRTSHGRMEVQLLLNSICG